MEMKEKNYEKFRKRYKNLKNIFSDLEKIIIELDNLKYAIDEELEELDEEDENDEYEYSEEYNGLLNEIEKDLFDYSMQYIREYKNIHKDISKCKDIHNIVFMYAKKNIENINDLDTLFYNKAFLDNIIRDYDFLMRLPSKYTQYIALYNRNERKEEEIEKIRELYKRYFDLPSDFQERLIQLHIEINQNVQNNIFKLPQLHLKKELIYFLHKTNMERDYFKTIQKIEMITGLDLKLAISFANKYDGTLLLEDVLKSNKIDNETKNKLLYLSQNGKIAEEIRLSDIIECSIDDLVRKDKVIEESLISTLEGGPRKGGRECALKNNKMIRFVQAVYIDGRTDLLEVGEQSKKYYHVDAAISLYEGKLNEKLTEDKRVLDIANSAVEELSAITINAESSRLIITMPKEISKEQKMTMANILKNCKDKCEIGISYYIEFEGQWKELYANDGDIMTLNDAKQQLGINESEQENQLTEDEER